MSDNTKIEWTDATWNPVTGCAQISPGCKNCYAKREWQRLSANPQTVYFGRKFSEVQCHPERLEQPLTWRKPKRIFVNSMSDLFHADVPIEFIDKVFGVMALASQHTFQVLTKRPERMLEYFCSGTVLSRIAAQAEAIAEARGDDTTDMGWEFWYQWPVPNVWLGVSVENQATADQRIPLLLEVPAAVRWVSAEPLLTLVDLSRFLHDLDWLVTGGESGHPARPTHPDWFRELRDQCERFHVPFLFKQWGNWLHSSQADFVPADIQTLIRERQRRLHPTTHYMWPDAAASESYFVGKKNAGRLLDGVLHNAYPLSEGE